MPSLQHDAGTYSKSVIDVTQCLPVFPFLFSKQLLLLPCLDFI